MVVVVSVIDQFVWWFSAVGYTRWQSVAVGCDGCW